MKLPVSRQYGPRGVWSLLCVLALAAIAAPAVQAQTRRETPDGMAVGRWFLSPYLFEGVELDDNVFLSSTDPESDQILRTTLGLEALLPVRRSALTFEYTADRFDYQENQFSREWAQEGAARWRMDFASGDRLSLTERYSLGISDTRAVDEGGELVFQGQAYNLNRWGVELSRSTPKRPGYLISFRRSDLNWEEPEDDEQIPFFDYRGFDSAVEYRHPVPPVNWLIAYASVRRFNHYEPRGAEDPVTGESIWEPGVPFREEESESVQIGMRGVLGREQPFFARVGWGRFAYTGEQASNKDFNGLVGQAQWQLRAGSRSRVEMLLNRRPLPSSFPTYYIVNEFRVRADREWLMYSRVGVDLRLSRNRYGEPVPGTGCGDRIRRDSRLSLEVFMDWLVLRRFGFRLAGAHYDRDSNCPGASYSDNTLTAGMTLGWF